MPVTTNTIADFSFIYLTQPPYLVQRPTIARVRPGGDGALMQSLGEWSEPFELVSKSEAQDVQAAYDLYDQYNDLSGGDSVDIVWGSVALSQYGHVFFVMGVEILEIKALVNAVGPNGQYYAHLICRWRIQPVVDLPAA